jgi:hypothetical protein
VWRKDCASNNPVVHRVLISARSASERPIGVSPSCSMRTGFSSRVRGRRRAEP